MKQVVPILIALAAFALALFVFLRTGGEQRNSPSTDPLIRLSEDNVIRAGFVVYPPSVSLPDSGGEPEGVFPDALRYIASETGAEVEWVETTWAGFIAGLQARQYDVAVGAFYETVSRAQTVAYTEPLYYLGSAVLVAAGEERFMTVRDLNQNGVSISVPQGTGEHDFAQRHLPKADLIVIPGSDLNLPLLEVVNGRADASISDVPTIMSFSAEHSGTQALFLDQPINLSAVAWTVRPEDANWLRFLNSSIRFMKTSGVLEAIEDEYSAPFLQPLTVWN